MASANSRLHKDICLHIENNGVTSGSIPSCAAEDIFICRLLQTDAINNSHEEGKIGFVKEALALRQTSTRELMKLLQDAIDSQSARLEDIARILQGKPSAEGYAFFILFSVDACICSQTLLYTPFLISTFQYKLFDSVFLLLVLQMLLSNCVSLIV